MSNNDFLVSIIVPAYNAEKYIGECIESVLNQTYTNWELLIVNDNSKDRTKEVVEEYVEKDSRIKLFTNEKNLGVTGTRNKAINSSKGRFIAFLDADDSWYNNKLEKQINFMLENNYAFTYTGYEMYYESNKRRKVIRVPKRLDYNKYIKNTAIGNLTVILDKELLGEISVREGKIEDALTWMKYLKKCKYAYGLNETLATYRVLPVSKSSNKFHHAMEYFYCLRFNENLPLIKSIYVEICYMFNALKKRII